MTERDQTTPEVERVRAEEVLRESERRSRAIIDGIPGFVATLEPNGNVEAVNRQIVEYTGHSLDELRHWGTNGIVHPDDLPQVIAIFLPSIAAGTPYEIEQRLRRHDGVYRWFANLGAPARDSDGNVERWHVLLIDIDEKKRAEEALRLLQSELARISRIASLGVLSASVAHEVSQPLSGIITNASTCLRMLAGNPPDVSGALETARRTIRDGNRAADVIARLRALFIRGEFALEPLDLTGAVREVIALSSNDLQRNRIVLQPELADDLPIITGDRIQLQQVILNLLRNAADAMADVHDRPRQLLIKTEREDGQRVRLAVRDAGVGLPPRSMDSLFDAFYTTKSGGMGIGLFVSRSIVEKHHGRLWAQPNDGAGATFVLSIPCASEIVADAAPAVRHS